ncbi:RNase adapter RapZ [Culicoidibacter larvae]|uniref:RNase adapter RapZ n=1 Tax=Culicoidibacter larvae TaxID=2579976 RepID=A0A5R8QHN7_9FIRM|nr:RNase adapter RapZ [Culicoidibacter larvae]TLG77304.1 RNase adapter RapZ [Culicoidibacter larvae]
MNETDNLNILFVCGMSGAGKTVSEQTLEDLGFVCMDNMPPDIIPTIAELLKEQSKFQDIAFVMDFQHFPVASVIEAIEKVKAIPRVTLQILFLDANDQVLIARYKETRRKHPLASKGISLVKAISREREFNAPLRDMADIIIDTSLLKAKQLKQKVSSLFDERQDGNYVVNFVSFGFKHGIPQDADFMVDVRFLPNPFYVEELRLKTGLDQEVIDFVFGNTETQVFTENLQQFLTYLLPQYQIEGRKQVVIAVGCTGGQHRSVAIAEYLKNHFDREYHTYSSHRDADTNRRILSSE